MLTVTDVRIHPGDSGFLVDDGTTSILYDTGFAFTGYQLGERVKEILGNRPLDYIFLTHSHYDHSLGAPYVKRLYPDCKIVAGEYDAAVFKKPTAKNAMRELDRKYAHTCGIDSYEDLVDELTVDIVVKDGESFRAGSFDFVAINLPGHTKSSLAYYSPSRKLLLSCESLGIFDGKKTVMPIYLISYAMTRQSILKAMELDIDNLLIPHFGLIDKETTKIYLEQSLIDTDKTTMEIKRQLEEGKTKQEVLGFIKKKFYDTIFEPYYPIDAFELNTSIMIDVIEKEIVNV